MAVVLNAAVRPETARMATKIMGMAAARWPRPGNFDSPISHRIHCPAALVHRLVIRPLSRQGASSPHGGSTLWCSTR